MSDAPLRASVVERPAAAVVKLRRPRVPQIERSAPLLELLRVNGDWKSPASLRLASGLQSATVSAALQYLLNKGKIERRPIVGAFDGLGHQRYEYRAVSF